LVTSVDFDHDGTCSRLLVEQRVARRPLRARTAARLTARSSRT
jgi:hypothetical protein